MGRTIMLDPIDHELVIAAEAARALDYIEAHLFEPLTVECIARHCNTSAFHFSRRFTERQGESVMAYVRGRRLDIAARRLAADDALALADLALETGFETQAAFTRAFTRAFGHAPGAFRRADAPPPRKRKLRMSDRPELFQRIEREGPIRLAGLSGRFDPSNYVRVPELWSRFTPHMGFPGQINGSETVGGFRHRDAIARSFEHLAAVRIAPDARPPAEFDIWELPAGAWIKFHQPVTSAGLHAQLIVAEAEIREERVPKSGLKLADTPDLQIYSANFQAAPGSWIEHWLPIRPD